MEDIKAKLDQLKKEKNAIILAHNYQMGEVQDVADFVGDSLELARMAAETDADMIVFAGVVFMAETAKILSPEKTVLIPRKDAGCPMANMIKPEQLRKLKEEHPDALAVTYVNSTAAVKMETDVCCTSGNAINLINKLDTKKIIFSPDGNLGAYCRNRSDKEFILWDGFCNVHHRFRLEELEEARKNHPDAPIICHPECKVEVSEAADAALSTSGMLKYVKESDKKEFVIGTEEGLIYRLQKENPDKKFYSLGSAKVCINMKKTTLNDVVASLEKNLYEIKLSDEVIERAAHPIREMLKYS